MSRPWHLVAPFSNEEFEELRMEVIFRGAKWDVQVGDVCTIARAPLILKQSTWNRLADTAERLDAELSAMEAELLGQPHLVAKLGLPRALLPLLCSAPSKDVVRIRRFDFHMTSEGVALSEVNADVPGGFHEGLVAQLYAQHIAGTRPPGDAASALAKAIATRVEPAACVALVHATAYSDDRQVMTRLVDSLNAVGLVGVPCAPDHLRWDDGCRLALGERNDRVSAVVRFFPAEWLPHCPRDCAWQQFFRGPVLLCNPATSIVAQSKRLPLVWDELSAPSTTWREALPTTLGAWDSRAPWWRDERWIAKPALGRVGEGIVALGISDTKALMRAGLYAGLGPASYVAQRRFTPLAWQLGDMTLYPCIGVFTLDGRVVGAYGRASHSLFVDHRAVDTPVLVAEDNWRHDA